MGENQELNTSLDFSSFDYTKLEELIKENQKQQKLLEEQQIILNEVLESQKKLVDYFVPTEEEILKKEELEKEQLLKEEELQKELEQEDLQKQKELEQEKNLEQQYNQEFLNQLTLLNENITNVEFANQNTNAYLYILCLGFLVAFVMSFIYKNIKKFF